MATTENQLIRKSDGKLRKGLAAANAVLAQGTFSFIDANGYHSNTMSTTVLGGLVRERVDNTGGSNGDKAVEVYRGVEVEVTGSGFAQANVGASCYLSDNYTATTTSASNTLLGEIVEYISATKVRVYIKD